MVHQQIRQYGILGDEQETTFDETRLVEIPLISPAKQEVTLRMGHKGVETM